MSTREHLGCDFGAYGSGLSSESKCQAYQDFRMLSFLMGVYEMRDVGLDTVRRNQLLWVLSAATFLIFFQAFMVAPIIPKLARVFDVSVGTIGLMVPAYLIPYGVTTLIYGPLSDRLGRRTIILISLVGFIVLTAITPLAHSASAMLWLRLVTGLVASGVVPIALALTGDLFPYNERGRALGWLFGAMAGGMAFGSTMGAVLEPFITWRGLFLAVAVLSLVVCMALLPYKSLFGIGNSDRPSVPFRNVIKAMAALLKVKRGARTYAYVLFNGIFHSGVFTWLGFYFVKRYGLSEMDVGLALLGYGIPGFLFGPLIGRLADHAGRNRLIPIGLAIAGLSTAAFAWHLPVMMAAIFVTTLSLGYDMTQPLLAGIVTDLSPKRGLAMGLNVFCLFLGFGLGSLVFSGALLLGFDMAFILFAISAVFGAALAIPMFRSETRPRAEV